MNSKVVVVVNRTIRHQPHQNHRSVLLVVNRLGANTVKRLEKIGIQSVSFVKRRGVGFRYNKPDLLKTRELFFVEVALRGTLPINVPNVVRKLSGMSCTL